MSERLELIGGRAHLNGVSFQTDDWYVKAFRTKKGINTDSSEKNMISRSNFLDDIPLIRGLMIPIRLVLFSWTFWILMITISGGLFFFTINFEERSQLIAENDKFQLLSNPIAIILLFLVLGTLTIKLTRIGKYHASEHMAIHAYEKG